MAQDPYTHAQTGLSVPEHDRLDSLEGAFGIPTRDRRSSVNGGQVFVLFDRNQKILKIYDKEDAALRASERVEMSTVIPMALVTNSEKQS